MAEVLDHLGARIAAGMIGHAVAYRSEAATALAWLLGFVSLNVAPLTDFALVAGILLALGVSLAASGLAVAMRQPPPSAS